LMQKNETAFAFYVLCCTIGLCNFWLLLVSIAVEHFGTDMRATAASAINMGRGTLVLTNALFLELKSQGAGMVAAAGATAVAGLPVGFLCLLGIEETFRRDMDYLESAGKPA